MLIFFVSINLKYLGY